ncbi:YtzI protein [Pontibacillus litoralis]|uniref:YtzI protein n=1 Tax=Pontibacillus litoralis JSM 072002 TaxID=1385512 RepID=A0A0A5HPQ2_9BACI|nr:YtzI protein [Pontibacillus litoralis]KGX85597.1 hypothetical protein N784_08795 [Pontibacillus litoralis JSM 072002]
MTTVFIIGVFIFVIVFVLSLITISKGYKYDHTIDPIPDQQKKDSPSS